MTNLITLAGEGSRFRDEGSVKHRLVEVDGTDDHKVGKLFTKR